MTSDVQIKQRIHAKIIELAKQLGKNATSLRLNDDIPASGLLDSPSLMELIVWCEMTFDIEIDQEALTLDTFGTIDSMAAYIEKRAK